LQWKGKTRKDDRTTKIGDYKPNGTSAGSERFRKDMQPQFWQQSADFLANSGNAKGEAANQMSQI
jgi:hypothetical protein